MGTSVNKQTQFEFDVVWYLKPVQLSLHNIRKRCTMWELQNKSGGGMEDGLCLFMQVLQTGSQDSVTVLNLSVDQRPKRSVQHLSSGNVG